MAGLKPGRRNPWRDARLRLTRLVTACYNEEYPRLHDGAVRREMAGFWRGERSGEGVYEASQPALEEIKS